MLKVIFLYHNWLCVCRGQSTLHISPVKFQDPITCWRAAGSVSGCAWCATSCLGRPWDSWWGACWRPGAFQFRVPWAATRWGLWTAYHGRGQCQGCIRDLSFIIKLLEGKKSFKIIILVNNFAGSLLSHVTIPQTSMKAWRMLSFCFSPFQNSCLCDSVLFLGLPYPFQSDPSRLYPLLYASLFSRTFPPSSVFPFFYCVCLCVKDILRTFLPLYSGYFSSFFSLPNFLNNWLSSGLASGTTLTYLMNE